MTPSTGDDTYAPDKQTYPALQLVFVILVEFSPVQYLPGAHSGQDDALTV